MITFEGIIDKVGKTSIIRFKNEKGAIADIPLDKDIGNIISLHLAKISTSGTKTVERTNIEDSDVNE